MSGSSMNLNTTFALMDGLCADDMGEKGAEGRGEGNTFLFFRGYVPGIGKYWVARLGNQFF